MLAAIVALLFRFASITQSNLACPRHASVALSAAKAFAAYLSQPYSLAGERIYEFILGSCQKCHTRRKVMTDPWALGIAAHVFVNRS
jgi:hypothetical protein